MLVGTSRLKGLQKDWRQKKMQKKRIECAIALKAEELQS